MAPARPVAPGRVAPAVVPNRGVAVRRPISNHFVISNGFPFHGRCINGFHCRNRFFLTNPFLFNAGFGFPYYGYIPGLGLDYGYNPYPQQQPVVAPESENGNDVQVAVALQRLSDEVQSVREEQARQANAARTPGASISAHQPEGETTFVFRDGRRVVTQNYAIAGQTLWLLSEHAAKKVSLSDLDVKATDQANSANGIDLRLPESY
jgi:hypothetical protein